MKSHCMYLLSLLLIVGLITSCSIDDDGGNNQPEELTTAILPQPESVIIDIPDALSFGGPGFGNRVAQDEVGVESEDLYDGLRLVVAIGEAAAEITGEILTVIIASGVADLESFTLISDDDGRTKNFEVTRDVTYNGVDYEFELNMFDEDGSQAAQIVWTREPFLGVATLNPYHIDRREDENLADTFLRIEFGQGKNDYPAFMEISITGFPPEEDDDEFLDNMKMFVGADGDIVEVYGNANFPSLQIIDPNFSEGRNYAFVARANDPLDIAVAQIGLPPSSVGTNENILEDYSIFNVFSEELMSAGIDNEELIALLLQGTEPPGYFEGELGLTGIGDDVPDNPGFTDEFIDLSDLSPFVPSEVRDLTLDFLGN
ncbi:MAG: hypothetical protein O6939_04910 [Bacteroidetes bacterium]|nr:hypothetical protein [Bacteroidota bacterium]